MKYLITGGGTGGHVYPAIAIADAIKELYPDSKILFAGTRSKMEWIAVPKAGYEIQPITISGLHRNFNVSNIILPFKLMLSLWQSRSIIRSFKPDAVICTGGYVSGPIGWVASLSGIPVFLQEQNSFPGWTTRKLAPKATMIFTAFEGARKYLPVSKIMLCGNPTRKELHTSTGNEAHKYFGFSSEKKTLLVLGGSGGAKAINDAIAANIKELHDTLDLQIIWQSGSRYLETINEVINPDSYQNLRLYSFVDHMTHAYSAADVVISRSGASICSELMVTGKPSIMVPSPNVAGDHQTSNARAMVDGGAASMLQDHELNSRLVAELRLLLSNDEKLKDMKNAALEMAKPQAANEIATHIHEMLHQSKRLN
jgi:UDP-N-acetylglucosamine--N-acetylmuramyl-(pentapeptide) pyrophosphoryl-undecaprenol N-acetylglucosamine transferase